jgi:acyl CoA:acetate/3-ketoacid CoA transferase
LLSFLQIDRTGSVNVSKLGARPHVTAGCGGFVDITARAKRIVLSGYFTVGAGLEAGSEGLRVAKEGKVKKLVNTVEQITFSGPRAVAQGQDVLYVTERCVMRLGADGVEVIEIAPGIDLDRDVLQQSEFRLRVAKTLKTTPSALYKPEPFKLELKAAGAPAWVQAMKNHSGEALAI